MTSLTPHPPQQGQVMECRFRRGPKCRFLLLRARGWLVAVFYSLEIAIWSLCSGCTHNLKCVQFVFKPPLSHRINVERAVVFYAMIHLSIDFGHISDSIPCAVAGALLHSFHCRVSQKEGFQKPAARALVLASRESFASWCTHVFKALDGAIGMVPNR